MIIRKDDVQHYVVNAGMTHGLSVAGTEVYPVNDVWSRDPIGFVVKHQSPNGDLEICLFEPISKPSTIVRVIATKLTDAQVDLVAKANNVAHVLKWRKW